MENKIPLVYQVIYNKFHDRSRFNELKIHEARFIIGSIFRIPKKKLAGILHEFHEWGLIKIANTKTVVLKSECFEENDLAIVLREDGFD